MIRTDIEIPKNIKYLGEIRNIELPYGTFDRFEEEHYQHGFTLEEVSDAVKKAGLKIRNVYDAFSHNAPDDNSERLYYIIEK